MLLTGRLTWFDLHKKFGFVALEDGRGDAFLHMSVLKAAGYVTVPAGTTLRVRVEVDQGKQRVKEIVEVDLRTAHPGEPPPIMRKNFRDGAPNPN